MVLVFSINLKKKKNVKNKKLNFSLHTKKTNKLIQVSYHFSLTKIQKLQNQKKKKRLFPDQPVRPVFKLVRNSCASVPMHVSK